MRWIWQGMYMRDREDPLPALRHIIFDRCPQYDSKVGHVLQSVVMF